MRRKRKVRQMLLDTPEQMTRPPFDASFKKQIEAIRAEYGSISNFLQKNRVKRPPNQENMWGMRPPNQGIKIGKHLSITAKS